MTLQKNYMNLHSSKQTFEDFQHLIYPSRIYIKNTDESSMSSSKKTGLFIKETKMQYWRNIDDFDANIKDH